MIPTEGVTGKLVTFFCWDGARPYVSRVSGDRTQAVNPGTEVAELATLDDLKGILPPEQFPSIELEGNLFIATHRIVDRDKQVEIPVAAVDEYLGLRNILKRPEPTSLFYPGHYEHLVERIGTGPFRAPLPLRDRKIRLSKLDGSITVEVSTPSTFYALAMMSDFTSTIGKQMYYPFIPGETRLKIEEFLRRYLSIKVSVAEGSPFQFIPEYMKALAEAAVFNLAYGRRVLLSLSRSWDRGEFQFRRGRPQDVQFPLRRYNSDLVSYYSLGLGSDSLLLAYLAFYKILEHFFPSVTEQGLHRRMTEKLIAPEFSHTKPKQLQQLASIVRKYDQRMQEEKMLAAVVEHFFAMDEVREWVLNHESSRGPYYTTPQVVLEEAHTLDLSPERFASSLAARIYHVRNALVHNKEGEVSRFIPYSGQESVLLAEIPIVQYLAEQVILRSGTDID
jgi:hypothetical protein